MKTQRLIISVLICTFMLVLMSHTNGQHVDIKITTLPNGAEVWLNNKFLGLTPYRITDVSSQAKSLRLELHGYDTFVTELNSFRSKVEAKLSPSKYGSLRVITKPKNAVIFLNGIYRGNSPMTLSSIEFGSHTIALSRVGFRPVRKSIIIDDVAPLELELELADEKRLYLKQALVEDANSIPNHMEYAHYLRIIKAWDEAAAAYEVGFFVANRVIARFWLQDTKKHKKNQQMLGKMTRTFNLDRSVKNANIKVKEFAADTKDIQSKMKKRFPKAAIEAMRAAWRARERDNLKFMEQKLEYALSHARECLEVHEAAAIMLVSVDAKRSIAQLKEALAENPDASAVMMGYLQALTSLIQKEGIPEDYPVIKSGIEEMLNANSKLKTPPLRFELIKLMRLNDEKATILEELNQLAKENISRELAQKIKGLLESIRQNSDISE